MKVFVVRTFACLLMVPGCLNQASEGTTALQTGRAHVRVPLVVGDITRVECVISADDMPQDMVVELAINAGAATGLIAQIPAGLARTFTINAYRDVEKVCTGSAVVDVVANERAAAAIVIQCAPDPVGLGQAEVDGSFNFSPTIESAVASVASVSAGGTVALYVTASDADSDPITYSWTATAGSFSEAGQATTTWTAPGTAGTETLTILVSDARGGSASLSVDIVVSEPASTCGWALSFSGTPGDRVEIAHNAILNPGGSSWTVEFWTRLDTATGSIGRFVGKFTGGGVNNAYEINLEASGKIGAHLSDGGASTTFLASSTTIAGDGQWHHVAYVRDTVADTLTLFLDGVLQSSTTDGEGAVDPSNILVFGNNWVNQDQPLTGLLDDVRIWSSARYTTGFSPVRCQSTGARPNLVGEWLFEEGSGTVAGDTSGNGNDGGIVGSVSFASVGSGSCSAPDVHLSLSSGACVDIGVPIVGTTDAFTIEAMVAVDSSYSGDKFIFRHHTKTDTNVDLRFYDGKIGFYFGFGSGFLTYHRVETPLSVLEDYAWHHIAATFGRPVLRLYIDGVLVDEVNNADHAIDFTGAQIADTFACGHDWSGPRLGHWEGDFGPVRISNVARAITPSCDFSADGDTVGLWLFDDGSGSTISDGAGSNHGTLTGSWAWVP